MVLVYYVLIVEDSAFRMDPKNSDFETAIRSEFNFPKRNISHSFCTVQMLKVENADVCSQRNRGSSQCSARLGVFRLPIR